jgi:hypothetical protein
MTLWRMPGPNAVNQDDQHSIPCWVCCNEHLTFLLQQALFLTYWRTELWRILETLFEKGNCFVGVHVLGCSEKINRFAITYEQRVV